MGVHYVLSGLTGAAELLLLWAHGAHALGARAQPREAAGGFRGECLQALGTAVGGTLSPLLS